MPSFSGELQSQINDFEERVLTDPLAVLDPEGVMHHGFISGLHGRKLDFDKIKEGTDFFVQWMNITGLAVIEHYEGDMPDAVVGIANGTNRVAKALAPLLDGVIHLETYKVDKKEVALTEAALKLIEEYDIQFALTAEDVGTTGSTVGTAVVHLREQPSIQRVESVSTWQRNDSLHVLEGLEVPNWALIQRSFPNYTPLECLMLSQGYCNQGIEFIPHGQDS